MCKIVTITLDKFTIAMEKHWQWTHGREYSLVSVVKKTNKICSIIGFLHELNQTNNETKLLSCSFFVTVSFMTISILYKNRKK